jgi:hypothetical protein
LSDDFKLFLRHADNHRRNHLSVTKLAKSITLRANSDAPQCTHIGHAAKSKTGLLSPEPKTPSVHLALRDTSSN